MIQFYLFVFLHFIVLSVSRFLMWMEKNSVFVEFSPNDVYFGELNQNSMHFQCIYVKASLLTASSLGYFCSLYFLYFFANKVINHELWLLEGKKETYHFFT